MKLKKPMSAVEYSRQRAAAPRDPAVLAKESERADAVAANNRAAEPILKELSAAGCTVRSISALRGRPEFSYCIPILLRWLESVENIDIKEELVRALSVPWAGSEAVSALLLEFVRAEGPVRWAIGNALEVAATPEFVESLLDLARERGYGSDRQMIVLALGKLGAEKAIPVLLELVDDQDVAIHAVMALGRLRAQEARSKLAVLAASGTSLLRKEAKKALGRIPKAPVVT